MTATTDDYRILDTTSVLELAAPHLGGTADGAEEIGDGNLNMVFRVRGGGRSLIVKQAVPYLRLAGEGWPLTRDRARIEAQALSLENEVAPGSVPHLFHFDERLSAIVMEDLAGYRVLRGEMIDQRDYPGAFAALGVFAAKTLFGTSALVMDPGDQRALAARFLNPELSAITDDLVFTSPFTVSDSNRIEDALEADAAALRANRAVVAAAARLRYAFRTRAEAIVHGDLHTGSVMVADGDTRVIDPEFAFAGPMAFDTGKMLGNLALSYLGHRAQGHADYAARVAGWAVEFWDAFVDEARRQWPPTEPWREPFLAELLSDSARFAGAVMCRRTVGLAGVADVRGIADDATRLAAQRASLAGGTALLTGEPVRSLEELWSRAVADSAYA